MDYLNVFASHLYIAKNGCLMAKLCQAHSAEPAHQTFIIHPKIEDLNSYKCSHLGTMRSALVAIIIGKLDMRMLTSSVWYIPYTIKVRIQMQLMG